jgi:hypothetical protein
MRASSSPALAIRTTACRRAERRETVAQRIIDRLAQPALVADRLIAVRASIGIAVAAPGAIDADQILHRADEAMYEAKRCGEHMWHRYRYEAASALGQEPTGTKPRRRSGRAWALPTRVRGVVGSER